MADHTLRVTGPEMTGSRISGPLLRDLLAMVTDGTRRALRMRIEGRSAAGGPRPSWVETGSNFDFLGVSEGSSIVRLEAPSLAQAAPATFGEGSFFVDNTQSAIDLFEESLADALAGKADSDRYDPAMLADFERSLERIFSHPVETLEFRKSNDARLSRVIGRNGIDEVRRLLAQTPPGRMVRVSGTLDTIRHSDRRLTLVLKEGAATCLASEIGEDYLRSLWGHHVVVTGKAVFRPSGKLLRIEAERIVAATEEDLELWSDDIEPLEGEVDLKALHRSQGPRTGINALIGQWPGEESDEEMEAILRGDLVIGQDDFILIDTNILVEVLRNKDKGRRIAEKYLSKRAERPLISMISVGEVLAIARRQAYGEAKITNLNKLLSELVIVKISRPVAEHYAKLQATLQKLGTPIGENDTWIAATAAATGSVLLSGDRDFEKIPEGLISLEIVEW